MKAYRAVRSILPASVYVDGCTLLAADVATPLPVESATFRTLAAARRYVAEWCAADDRRTGAVSRVVVEWTQRYSGASWQ